MCDNYVSINFEMIESSSVGVFEKFNFYNEYILISNTKTDIKFISSNHFKNTDGCKPNYWNNFRGI